MTIGIKYYEYTYSTSSEDRVFYAEDRIFSSNGMIMLRIQEDGKCILAANSSKTIWRTTELLNFDFARAILHSDGNFVVYDNDDAILWSASSTNGTENAPFYLFVHDDGYLYIANKNHAVIWSAGNVPDIIEHQSLVHENANSYQLVNIAMNWHDAEKYCQREYNSHLASVHSSAEFNKVTVTDVERTKAWIGLRRVSVNSSKHVWSDGSPRDYGLDTNHLPWKQFKDPSLDYKGMCVQVRYGGSGPDGQWDDFDCSGSRVFLCNVKTTTEPPTAQPTSAPSTLAPSADVHLPIVTNNTFNASAVNQTMIDVVQIEVETTEYVYPKTTSQSLIKTQFDYLDTLIRAAIAVCICSCSCIFCSIGCLIWRRKKAVSKQMERGAANSIASLNLMKSIEPSVGTLMTNATSLEMAENDMFALYPLPNDFGNLLSPKHVKNQMSNSSAMYLKKQMSLSTTTKGYKTTPGYEDDDETLIAYSEGGDIDEVRSWLESMGIAEIVSYYAHFVDNGFDSLKLIKEIDKTEQLKEMGIQKMAHQIVLMKQIKKLQSSEAIQEGDENEETLYISDED